MNFGQASINELMAHSNRKMAIEYLQRQITVCKADIETVQAVSYRQVVNTCSGNSTESKVVGGIGEIEGLEMRLDAIKQIVDIVDDALGKMDREHRLALEYFYIHKTRYAGDRLCKAIGCSLRTSQRIRVMALKKFTEIMYGRL